MIHVQPQYGLKVKMGEGNTTNAPHVQIDYALVDEKTTRGDVSQVESVEHASFVTNGTTELYVIDPITQANNENYNKRFRVKALYICNRDTVARTAFVFSETAGGTEYYGIAGMSIPAASTLQVLDNGEIVITPETVNLSNDSVTNAILTEMSALTVKANPTNATANPQDVAFSNDGDTLLRIGTALSTTNFGALTTVDPALTDEIPLSDASDSNLNKNTTTERLLAHSGHIVEGRLTLTTATPVTTSDVTAATTIYFTPFRGNRVRLFDGTRWKIYIFTERSVSLGTITSGRPYDVFLYDNSGTLTLEILAWTNTTTRATALTTQDGVLVKNGETNKLWLGTFYTTSTTETEDSLRRRLVYSWYNQVQKPLYRHDSTSSWTYTGSTNWRQANAGASNQVEIMNGAPAGYATGIVEVNTSVNASNDTVGGFTYNSIGEDSATTPHTNSHPGHMRETTLEQIESHLRVKPAIGFHFYAWLETVGNSANTGTYQGTAGTGAGQIKSGMNGSWLC